MTSRAAQRKYDSLCRMTVANGCTEHEARTAARLATQLAQRFGFRVDGPTKAYREGFEERFARAEKRAAMRWRWEYRRCGKARCRCAGPGKPAHGPYKYAKQRRGRKVVSVYIGR